MLVDPCSLLVGVHAFVQWEPAAFALQSRPLDMCFLSELRSIGVVRLVVPKKRVFFTIYNALHVSTYLIDFLSGCLRHGSGSVGMHDVWGVLLGGKPAFGKERIYGRWWWKPSCVT